VADANLQIREGAPGHPYPEMEREVGGEDPVSK